MKQKLTLLFMLIFTVFLVVSPVSAQVQVDDAYTSAAKYMVKKAPNPTYGDEWFIIALARGEGDVPKGYFDTYYKNLVAEVKELKGELHELKYTEYSRVILALSAIGKDATNVGGYNLVNKLSDFDLVAWQGVNGPIFALLALDSHGYTLPQTATNSREKMVDFLLSKQLSDGGFSLAEEASDADMTAMAVQALSSYTEDERVKITVERAVIALAKLQDDKGFYANWEAPNAESAAQVVTALTSVSVDPAQDASFKNVLSSLLTFYHAADGGFKHVAEAKGSNAMATEQVAYALASYKRFLAGKTKLYDMTDTKKVQTAPVVPPVQSVGFKDMANHWAKADVEKATALGLLKGYDDNTFRPNNELTRVQAISILVRALGLQGNASPFTDITNYNAATKQEIAAAYEAGLLVTKGSKLLPTEKISRQELAVMLQRAYRLKTGTVYETSELAPLKDIAQLNKEAQQAITFLYDFEIAQGADGWFKPNNTTTRAHAAKMLVQFLQVVK
ncbi:MAG: S-layer homology domain-containing protein [Solibacillus sp.]